MRTSYNLYSGITKVKSKTKQFANKLTFGIAAGVASIGLAVIPMASAAGTVTVSPSNLQNWYNAAPAAGGSIAYVQSDGAPLGTGAVQLTTTSNSDYTRLKNDINVPLSSIHALAYSTKQIYAPTAPTIAAVNLRLYITSSAGNSDCTGTSEFNDVLVYEPYYNAPVTNDWQTWNAQNGYWWSNCEVTYNGHVQTGAGGANNFHLSDVLATDGDAHVTSIGLGTGNFNSPWTVQADALVVNDTTYNFEPDASPKDQCKGNGWKTMKADNGTSFKNQGACVSYFASNGKSQH